MWRFFHLCCASSWTTQNSDRPGDIDQIHELILKDRRISAKLITKKRASHVSGLGPSFMKIWTCWNSPRSESRNVWKRMKNVNGASRPSNFWIFSARSNLFPVGRDWWPWTKPGYITMTRRQSNSQWSGGIVAHPALPQKIPSAKIRWKSSRLDFLRSRQHPPHWLSSKGPKYQSGVLLISAGAIEGHFEGKTLQEGH